MAIVFEEYNTEEQSSVVRFLWAKGFNSKDIHKEMFPVYCGKYLSRGAVHNWVTNVSLMTKKFETEARNWLRQQSQHFYGAGFDLLVKR
jgi:hypothetical protein